LASKSSFLTKDIAGEKPSSLKITQSYNEKTVFHCDDDTKALINGVAHQLNGLSYIIDDSEKKF
jgi:hypothetical protein